MDGLTAQEDGSSRLEDADLLDRATALGRVLFTRDTDLLVEATRRLREGRPFGGLLFAHQLQVTIGQCVRDLALLARASEPSDLIDASLTVSPWVRHPGNEGHVTT